MTGRYEIESTNRRSLWGALVRKVATWLRSRHVAGLHSNVWVTTCDETHKPAIVEVRCAADGSQVGDCSCWCGDANCGRTCLSRLSANEKVRSLTG